MSAPQLHLTPEEATALSLYLDRDPDLPPSLVSVARKLKSSLAPSPNAFNLNTGSFTGLATPTTSIAQESPDKQSMHNGDHHTPAFDSIADLLSWTPLSSPTALFHGRTRQPLTDRFLPENSPLFPQSTQHSLRSSLCSLSPWMPTFGRPLFSPPASSSARLFRRTSNSRSLSPWMRNGENSFSGRGSMLSGLREERRGRSPTRRFLGSNSSPISPSMGIYPGTIFTSAALDYQGQDYHTGSTHVSGVEPGRGRGIPPAEDNQVQGSPRAAHANRQRRRRRGGRRPSCPRGGVQRAANGAAWEVSRRYGASNVDGMDNEAGEEDLQEENFFPGNYALQPPQDVNVTQPEPENPALPPLASHFISTISTTSRDIVAAPTSSTVQAVLDSLQRNTLLHSPETAMDKDSLATLAGRCALADQATQAADLVYMLSCIALRAKVISISWQTSTPKTTILKRIKWAPKHWKTLERYVSDGGKYTLFAGAGSIFFLVIIAAAGLQGKIRKLTHDVVMRLQHLIRCPDPNIPLGKAMMNDIIPAIAALRKNNRITFISLFNNNLLLSHGTPPDIEASDFTKSDEFFDSLTFNAIIKKRAYLTWKSCFKTLPPSLNPHDVSSMQACLYSTTFFAGDSEDRSSLPQPQPQQAVISQVDLDMQELDTPNFASERNSVHIINTSFDHEHEFNKKLGFPPKNKKKRHRYTQKERGYVEHATKCTSLEDFQEKIVSQLSSGSKSNRREYIKLLHKILEGQQVRVNDKNGDVMFIVIPDMPDDIRNPLLNDLELAHPDVLQAIDSKAGGEKAKFQHIHYQYWNRYHVNGNGAPSDVDPAALKRAGAKRFNTAQITPRTSMELQENCHAYEQLQISLEGLFQWLRITLEKLLPKEYEILSQYCDILPADGIAPAYPFGGWVINLNVSTLIHRDYQDLKLCLVVVASDCEGGDLCFEKPGVSLELRNGDAVIFASSKLSHFNTHFKGKRASLVFHSDVSAKAWVENRNGWDHTLFMNVYDDGAFRTGQIEFAPEDEVDLD
ncbi:hypothetical protein M413DRAFT_25716 [Hebeloma cylindrosporum]|uniref:2OGFeDO JBP1/TET oxygenase domain-containing protein n=1 Tax=Hebeloma cylindrosporum TaxID=76867 RepID=A0A0C3CJL6_HEBCY|nr:hypothetical protein M413DRAFT_25716 [Hebeloma cylindrosporum h7]